MSELVVVGFKKDKYRASDVLDQLRQLDFDWVIDLDDAVKPSYAHNALTTLVENGEEIKILRHNMPFGNAGGGESGTFFIAYARSPILSWWVYVLIRDITRTASAIHATRCGDTAGASTMSI